MIKDAFLTIKQMAAELGISQATARLIAQKIGYTQFGLGKRATWLVEKNDFQNYVDQRLKNKKYGKKPAPVDAAPSVEQLVDAIEQAENAPAEKPRRILRRKNIALAKDAAPSAPAENVTPAAPAIEPQKLTEGFVFDLRDAAQNAPAEPRPKRTMAEKARALYHFKD